MQFSSIVARVEGNSQFGCALETSLAQCSFAQSRGSQATQNGTERKTGFDAQLYALKRAVEESCES